MRQYHLTCQRLIRITVRVNTYVAVLDDCIFPAVRLHDAMGRYGGTCYVDVPNIFTDFSADENDPASYHFEFTDAYLAGLVDPAAGFSTGWA